MTENLLQLSEQEVKEREELQFYFDLIEGRIDYRNKLLVLQDLTGPVLETTARLTPGQQLFGALALSAYQQWPKIFKPLRDYAVHVLRLSVSAKGEGRRETVDLARATSEGNKSPSISLAQVTGGKQKVEKPEK